MDKKQEKSNLSTEQRYKRFNSLINRLKRLEGGEFRNALSFYDNEGLVFVYDDKGKKLQEPNLDSHRGGLNDLLVGNMIIVDPRFTAGEIPDTEASIYKISGKPGDHKLTKTTFADYAVSCDKSIKKPQMEPRGFFGKLRDKLSWLLGKSEAQKKFDRKCDVFNAKKNDFLNKTFGLDIKFDKDLLNDEYAENHINGKTAPKKEDVKKAAVSLSMKNPQKKRLFITSRQKKSFSTAKKLLKR